ncbi:MAG TPA: aldo/keto reductase family protein [Myxococcaceae bacterium]|nr:aldo/keto reductase family protein [Myxococcaceae bacterium]
MQFRQLGKSDLRVSDISLGSWLTYSGGVERSKAEACVARAFEVGINFIDTANVYGRGASETFLGEVLAGRKRDSYVLATKLFFPMSSTDRGLSAAQIRKQIDASLKRLKTDYVDLYQCHRYDPSTPLEETMEALTEVVRSGKARYIGFSEWNAEQIRASQQTKGEHFVSSQPQYSALWRVPEKEVIPHCAKTGIGQIVWSPLAQGILTGKYQPGQKPPADSRASSESMGGFMGDWLSAPVLTAVQNLKPIAAEVGCTLSQLALAWVLREPNVSSAIIGATRPEQVTENAAASEIKLSADVLKKIDQVLGDLPVR